MFGAPMIALDVGTMNTKITVGKWNGDGLHIHHALMAPTPSQAVTNGHLAEPLQLADELRIVLRKNGIRKGSMLFTADSTEIIMREIVVPWAPAKDLEAVISFEVAKHFPVRIQDYVIQHRCMDDFEVDGVRRVRLLAVAMPKDMVEGYWDLASGLGFKPVGLEMQATSAIRLLACAREVNDQELDHAATYALIDIGHGKLRVSFMAQGVLSLTRTFAIGGKQVDQAMALAFNTSADQARELKHQASLLPPKGGEAPEMAQAREILQAKVGDWLLEIQPLFRYYLGLDENNRIDGIFVYGGGSLIPGLAGHFQEVFNRPVQVVGKVSSVIGNGQTETPLQYFLNGAGALALTKAGVKA